MITGGNLLAYTFFLQDLMIKMKNLMLWSKNVNFNITDERLVQNFKL